MACWTLTQNVDCDYVPKLDMASCTLNLPPLIIAHRRRDFTVQGRVLVLPGAFQPITDGFDDVVIANPATMAPAGAAHLVLPCAGYYLLRALTSFQGEAAGTVLGAAVAVNGVIHSRHFWPAPNGVQSNGWAEIEYRYAAGDQVSVLAWSEAAAGTLSGSFDIYAVMLAK